ncbi:hypothetical protein PENARI_c006G06059 [Penicillium arizonense]|uniref:Uncharacterized protein n=1 Tax=Penicillium arizonense TaxID=1835702 RepID=A0A1F5LLM2_PENAI|nr:hypothetical protein PENARI_c006G06059 [Penicillium arizonense]OGE54132.1 hypothetical protein PENARI_c006G06059 [Penicillium arizonense]
MSLAHDADPSIKDLVEENIQRAPLKGFDNLLPRQTGAGAAHDTEVSLIAH